MIDRTVTRTVQGNLNGDRIAMTVDMASMEHVVLAITKMYSDPLGSVIREYSTNAWDAHIEAGTTHRPIEVVTPSSFQSFLTIRDFGVGLSVEDVHHVYSRYGASTKRETDEQAGKFGLGSKSALAYSDQFTVTSVKDKVRVQISVSMETGAPVMTIIDTSRTDEDNGTTIVIPVRTSDWHTCERKVKDFFRFWKPGSVLVNGNQPQHFSRDSGRVADDIYMIDEHTSFCVMGQVAYPMNHDAPVEYGHGLVFFVDMGEVDITPSREALMYTDRTKATIAKYAERYVAEVRRQIIRDVREAKSGPDALRNLNAWNARVSDAMMPEAKDLQWRGRAIPTKVVASATQDDKRFMLVPGYSGVLSRHSLTRSIQASYLAEHYWVEGYDLAKKWTPTRKRKLVKWAEGKGLTLGSHDYFVFAPNGAIDRTWIAADKIVQWSDIDSIVLPSVPGNGGGPRKQITGSFECYEPDSKWRSEKDAASIDQSKPVLWVSNQNKQDPYYTSDLRKMYFPTATTVVVPANRLPKFLRDFPNARKYADALAEAAKAWVATLTKDQLEAIRMRRDYWRPQRTLSRLDATRIDDPTLRDAVKFASADVDDLFKRIQHFESIVGDLDIKGRSWDNPMERYPLAAWVLRQDYNLPGEAAMSDFYLYINAAYAAQQKGA